MKRYNVTVEKHIVVFGEEWYGGTVEKTCKMAHDEAIEVAAEMVTKYQTTNPEVVYRVYCNEVNGWNEVIKRARVA